MRSLGQSAPRVPAIALVLTAVLTVQCGSALATKLFDRVGPEGAVLLRTGMAAIVLLALSRPGIDHIRQAGVRDVLVFGLTFLGMNSLFYAAIDRIPLGTAVTLEFVGPLAVAIVGSHRRLDFLWALLAAAGIVLLSDGLGSAGVFDLGALLALAAGGCWGLYIIQGARIGAALPGLGALAVAVSIAAVLSIPFGVAQGGSDLLVPSTLAIGLAVAVISSVIPYSLELEALRRLPSAVFGVLMSIEPAVAALIGFVLLGQGLELTEVLAIGLVVIASAGALRTATSPPRDS
ncbi:MAG: EamA family transporter [Actinobacteria bacterium]|nr:EamA family transporter [Actinomycetota bacterium]